MTHTKPFKKIIRIGTQKEYDSRGKEVEADIFCKIEYRDKGKDNKFELSISGVIGPKSNGDCLGSCGQIDMSLSAEDIKPAANWSKTKIKKLLDIWDKWHLNDMNAATPEMKAQGWDKLASKEIFKYSYSMTSDSRKYLDDIKKRCEYAALQGEIATINDTEKRLLQSKTYCDIYAYELPETPEFMEPSKDYNTGKHKIERKTLGWVNAKEHEDGLLGRELNGLKYGHSWYYEAVPEDVLKWLYDLPDTDKTPVWI